VQAIVLVGGEGTRLRPLTFGTPKPMVPIMNVPFLARTLERLYDVGIRDVILPAGYMPQAITEYFGDGSRLGMNITYVIEDEPLGTAGAIKNVEQHITGPFFVMNGDVLTSLDLQAMIDYHTQKGGLGVLHLIRVEDPSAQRDLRVALSSALDELPPEYRAGEITTDAYVDISRIAREVVGDIGYTSSDLGFDAAHESEYWLRVVDTLIPRPVANWSPDPYPLDRRSSAPLPDVGEEGWGVKAVPTFVVPDAARARYSLSGCRGVHEPPDRHRDEDIRPNGGRPCP